MRRDLNPGAGSVRMTAGGPSRGRISMHKRMSASRSVSRRSLSMSMASVYDVTHSLTTRTSCRFPFSTSAANDVPMTSGGSLVVSLTSQRPEHMVCCQ